MSAAYCKELLQDLAINRVSLDIRADLLTAIKELYKERAFSYLELFTLNMYLAGYTTQEIARYVDSEAPDVTSQEIERVLDRIITAIAYASGYTDDLILQRVQMSKQPRSKKENAKKVLERISNEY